jgi:hypothetical protein
MNPRGERRTVRQNRVDGMLAEVIVADKDYRRADAAPYLNGTINVLSDETVILAHASARSETQSILHQNFSEHIAQPTPERNWDLRRAAARAELAGVALGSFSEYFKSLNGETAVDSQEATTLPAGDINAIRTNHQIVSVSNTTTDPIEFFGTALSIIDRQETRGRRYVGPENYSTALKFFSDKYVSLDTPQTVWEASEMKELVTDCLDGFFDIAEYDAPNYLEMTNVYSAIRMLPAKTVEQRFTKPLLGYSLDMLDQYSRPIISTMFGAIAKLDLSEEGEAAAQLVDLGLRKSKHFEKTTEMRVALRAIEQLPPTSVSESAFTSFLEYRNKLESALDLDGADEVVFRLKNITTEVIKDPELQAQARLLGEEIARKVFAKVKLLLHDGSLTRDQERNVRSALNRVMTNYKLV